MEKQRVSSAATISVSDEAHCHLSTTVNRQHFRCWTEENPHEMYQTLLHSLKVTVWLP